VGFKRQRKSQEKEKAKEDTKRNKRKTVHVRAKSKRKSPQDVRKPDTKLMLGGKGRLVNGFMAFQIIRLRIENLKRNYQETGGVVASDERGQRKWHRIFGRKAKDRQKKKAKERVQGRHGRRSGTKENSSSMRRRISCSSYNLEL
jgi:hypothetical protein